jgi:hypothetical protein
MMRLLVRYKLAEWSIIDAVGGKRYRTAEGSWGRIDILSSYIPGSARLGLPLSTSRMHFLYRVRVWDHGRLTESRPLSQEDYDELSISLRSSRVN